MKLNLHLLRIFMTVAELRSFSRAGEALHISQPAVSKSVRELEHQLDLPLIARGGVARGGAADKAAEKGVRLTDNGLAVLAHARSIFAMERAATQDIQARVGLTRGSLAIGASTTVGAYWLPAWIGRFCTAFPGIAPRLSVGNTQAVCEQLLACEVDLAIVEGPVADERILATHWRDDPLALIAPPGTAMPAGEDGRAWLDRQRWIVREPGSGTREVTRRILAAQGLAPAEVMEVSSSEAIVRLVAAGAGVSLLPAVIAADLLALGQVARIELGDLGNLGDPRDHSGWHGVGDPGDAGILDGVPDPARQAGADADTATAPNGPAGVQAAPAAPPAGPRLSRPLFLLRLKGRPESPAARAFLALLPEGDRRLAPDQPPIAAPLPPA